jgi:Protein of unknown function (DUF3761)
MKKLLTFVLALALAHPVWPQAQPKPAPAQNQGGSRSGPCGPDYYRNVNGVCVHRPVKTDGSSVPAGATAQCRNGSYSFSQSHRGTCSHHGGVARWFR